MEAFTPTMCTCAKNIVKFWAQYDRLAQEYAACGIEFPAMNEDMKQLREQAQEVIDRFNAQKARAKE